MLDPDWTGDGQSYAPEIAPPRRRRRWGLLVNLLVIVAVLALVGFVTRTAIHVAVDSQLALVMTQSVGAITGLDNTAQTYAVTEDAVNRQIKANMPSGTGIDKIAITFAPGQVVMKYATYGQSGTIITGLAVESGRVVLVDTQVEGIVGWVESGDELARTANQALSKLQTPYGVDSVQIQQGVVTLTLKPPPPAPTS